MNLARLLIACLHTFEFYGRFLSVTSICKLSDGIFARIAADYEYFKLTDIQLHNMADNKVLATLRYHEKLRKNTAVIDVQAAHLWTLSEGKVIGFQQYAVTKQLADANRGTIGKAKR